MNTCPDYERGFIDGMQKQAQSSVDRAVNRMAQPEQEHAEGLAKLGWQYFECPACGSEGARAFLKPEQQRMAKRIEELEAASNSNSPHR